MDSFLAMIVFPFLSWSTYGWLGLLGGLASYGYPPSTENRFSLRMFISKLVASFFVGKVFGVFISDDNTFKSGYIMVLGFFAYPILAVLEARVRTLADKFFPPGAP